MSAPSAPQPTMVRAVAQYTIEGEYSIRRLAHAQYVYGFARCRPSGESLFRSAAHPTDGRLRVLPVALLVSHFVEWNGKPIADLRLRSYCEARPQGR